MHEVKMLMQSMTLQSLIAILMSEKLNINPADFPQRSISANIAVVTALIGAYTSRTTFNVDQNEGRETNSFHVMGNRMREVSSHTLIAIARLITMGGDQCRVRNNNGHSVDTQRVRQVATRLNGLLVELVNTALMERAELVSGAFASSEPLKGIDNGTYQHNIYVLLEEQLTYFMKEIHRMFKQEYAP